MALSGEGKCCEDGSSMRGLGHLAGGGASGRGGGDGAGSSIGRVSMVGEKKSAALGRVGGAWR